MDDAFPLTEIQEQPSNIAFL